MESYSCLFHFDGTLRDEASPEAAEATAFGAATVSKEGLRLAENGGARYPRLLLPAAGGQLAPCTLTLRLELEEGSAGRDLIATRILRPGFPAEARPGRGRAAVGGAAACPPAPP